MRLALGIVLALAGCVAEAPGFRATSPGAPPPAKRPDQVAVMLDVPPWPARVLGVADYHGYVQRGRDREPIIAALRGVAARAGADALVFGPCLVHLGCVPRAIALSRTGATHVLAADELPSMDDPAIAWQAGSADPFWPQAVPPSPPIPSAPTLLPGLPGPDGIPGPPTIIP